MSKTIGDYTAAVSINASSDYFLLQQSGAYKKINRSTILGISGSPVGDTDTQSLTNKTLDNTTSLTIKDGSLTLQNSSSTTKQAVFSLSSITAGQTRTITVPDSNLTLVGTTLTQTLTNKTLTSPTISGGSIDNSTITVDSIAGHTAATSGTIYGMSVTTGMIGNSALAASSVNTTQIASGIQLVNKESNPYKFSAYKSAATQTVNTGAATTVVFDVEEFDTNSNFAANTYTVPVTGFYFINAASGYIAVASGTRMFLGIYVNGSEVKRGEDKFTNALSGSATVCALISLTAGQTVDVRATPVGANTTLSNNSFQTYFQGFLMSAT